MPSIEIQLPRWVSNTAHAPHANMQVAEINIKTLPEIDPITLPEIEIDLITLPEINPKTLPEIKTFIDSEETGREFYNTETGIELSNGLSGQESNLPIILFGAVVIAVIIYIG